MNIGKFVLRPGVKNTNQWQIASRQVDLPARIQRAVLARDDHTCVSCGHRAMTLMHIFRMGDDAGDDVSNLCTICSACHAVLDIRYGLGFETLEIWRSSVPQVEIVRATRSGIRCGLTLQEINATFDLRRGRFSPNSVRWANGLLATIGIEQRSELPMPLCAIFVNFSQWQLEP